MFDQSTLSSPLCAWIAMPSTSLEPLQQPEPVVARNPSGAGEPSSPPLGDILPHTAPWLGATASPCTACLPCSAARTPKQAPFLPCEVVPWLPLPLLQVEDKPFVQRNLMCTICATIPFYRCGGRASFFSPNQDPSHG
jgi:hypothetical protein